MTYLILLCLWLFESQFFAFAWPHSFHHVLFSKRSIVFVVFLMLLRCYQMNMYTNFSVLASSNTPWNRFKFALT